MKINRGFTLIEIVAVMTIISIIMSVAALNTDFNFSKKYLLGALSTRLYGTILLAQEQAIIENNIYGLILDRHSFKFVRFSKKNKQWVPVKEPTAFSNYQYDDSLSITILKKSKGFRKLLTVFYPSGEITPFSIKIDTENGQSAQKIVGYKNGHVEIVKLR